MRLVVVLALVASLVAPASGYASNAGRVIERTGDPILQVFLRYLGDYEELNQLLVRLDGSDYVFEDDGAQIQPGSKCSLEGEHVARCERDPTGFDQVQLLMELGDDRVQVAPLADPLLAWGGEGNDFIASENATDGRDSFAPAYDEIDGGPGDDELLGGPGADLISGGKFGGFGCFSPECGGRETIDGRAGDDIIQDSDAVNETPVDRDVLRGGPGRDRLDYSPRHVGSVRVSLDPATAGWADNEDDIGGFEDLAGTRGDDSLTGDGGANEVVGGEGGDFLSGRAGQDALLGGADRDSLFGGGGADLLTGGSADDLARGLAGRDVLDGGRGRDSLSAGEGDDDLRGRSGSDFLLGDDGRDAFDAGTGDDVITSADGTSERVECGDGDDTVLADPRDRLIGCEHIRRRR